MTAVLPATGSATGLRLVAHHDLGGHGDGMQVLRERAIRVLDVGGDSRGSWRSARHPSRTTTSCRCASGAHNLHENRPGSYRSERLIFATYFSAGIRAYDLADPDHPVATASTAPGSHGAARRSSSR